MISIVEQINEFGFVTMVIGFLLAISALIGIKELIGKIKNTFGLVDMKELEKKQLLERVANLEDKIKEVDKRVTDTSNMYDCKLEGFHQQSIQIRERLSDDIVAVKHTQDDIKSSLLDLKHIVIDDKIDTIRWEILEFSSRLASAPNGKYNKEQFDHVFELESKYQQILDDYDIENGKFTISMAFIKKKYAEFMENGFN